MLIRDLTKETQFSMTS